MNKRYVHNRNAILAGLIVSVITMAVAFYMEVSQSGKINLDGLYFCIGSALVVFILFTISLGLFFHYQNRAIRKVIFDDLEEGEQLIVEGAANKIKDGIYKGGKLLLSDHRLIFKQAENGSIHTENIFELEQIRQIDRVRYAGIMETGFRIELENRSVEFSLDYPSVWRKLIEGQKKL